MDGKTLWLKRMYAENVKENGKRVKILQSKRIKNQDDRERSEKLKNGSERSKKIWEQIKIEDRRRKRRRQCEGERETDRHAICLTAT